MAALGPIADNITAVADNTANTNIVAITFLISQKATVDEATALAIALGG